MTTVSVVIPTYNEAETIVDIVTACRAALQDAGYAPEIIVVDDDSPDETWRIVRETFPDEDVTVIRRLNDHGLGSAVADGMLYASGTYVAVIDADFQHPPDRLPDLIAALETADADVAIGSRFAPGGSIEGWSRGRRLVSWGGRLLSRVALDEAVQLSDPMSGFFAVRGDLVDGLTLEPVGYKILLEVVGRARPDRVVEVPYTFQDRRAGESNLDAWETARFATHMLGLAAADVRATDAALLAVGALPLVAEPIPLPVAGVVFVIIATLVGVRVAQKTSGRLAGLDRQLWRPEP